MTHLSERPATADPARGITRLGLPRVYGTLIGAAGASSFVWGGKDALGSPWSAVAVHAWAVAMTAYLVWAPALPRPFPAVDVHPRAGLTYLLSVLAMLVTINAGGRVLVALDRKPLAIAVTVVAVGAPCLPFARAFHTPTFAVLGWGPMPTGPSAASAASPRVCDLTPADPQPHPQPVSRLPASYMALEVATSGWG